MTVCTPGRMLVLSLEKWVCDSPRAGLRCPLLPFTPQGKVSWGEGERKIKE